MSDLKQDRAREVPAIFDNYCETVAGFIAGLRQRGASIGDLEKFAPEAYVATAARDDVALFWVDGPMLELAAEVAERLPADTAFEDIQPPAAHGFVVFAERLHRLDALTGTQTTPVDGMGWCPGRFPWREEGGALQQVLGRSYLSVYRSGPEDVEHRNIRRDGVMWVPLGRSDWCYGETIDRVASERRMNSYVGTITPEQDEAFRRAEQGDGVARIDTSLVESAAEDRRLLAALWMLMSQTRTADVSRWAPKSKAARRRAQRASREPSVTVIHLRRERPDVAGPVEPEEGGHVRKYRHQWYVAPFPRWQAYGPKMSLRKLILVEGHKRGPDGAPWVKRKRVWALDR